MNTKVEEALAIFQHRLDACGTEDCAFCKIETPALATLAAHIAQQDDALEREQGVREDVQRQLAERDATIARAVAEVAQFREVAAENDRLRAACAKTVAAWDAIPQNERFRDYPLYINGLRAALNQEQVK